MAVYTYGSVRGESKSNVTLTVAVLDVDVVHLEVLGVDTEGSGLVVIIDIVKADAGGDGDGVLAVARSVGGVTVDGQLGLAGGNVDLLVVGAGLDEDDLGVRGRGGKSVNGILDLGVGLAATDDESARRSSGPGTARGSGGRGSSGSSA